MSSSNVKTRGLGIACALLGSILVLFPRQGAGQNRENTAKPAAPANVNRNNQAPANRPAPNEQRTQRPNTSNQGQRPQPNRPPAPAPHPGPQPRPPVTPDAGRGQRPPVTPDAGRGQRPPVNPDAGRGQRPPVRPDFNRGSNGGPVRTARPGETSRPLPGGGSAHHDARTNTTVNTGPDHRVTSVERPGLRATNFRQDGRAGHIENTRADGSRMVVDRGFRGERHVEVVRPGGVRVVAVGRVGYVERPLRAGYVSRTYVIGGRPSVFVYRSYRFRGLAYYTYVPSVYYAPAFYGWAFRPWGVRVAFAWGWGPAPVWFYGGYFAPYPYYTDPAMWMTDYVIAQNLQLAYQSAPPDAASAGAPPPPADTTLSPEQMAAMKQMIAQEVRQQLQDQQAAAAQSGGSATGPTGGSAADAGIVATGTGGSVPPASGTTDAPPPALDPNQRTFVVSSNLTVTVPPDAGCALSGGDIIYRSGDLQTDGKIPVTVLSSKPGDCKANSSTSVELAALQDMLNQFRQQIAAGMDTLASKEGQDGIPPGPAANPVRTADGQAQPAPDVQTALAQLNQEADQTENDIRQAAGTNAAPLGELRAAPAGPDAIGGPMPVALRREQRAD